MRLVKYLMISGGYSEPQLARASGLDLSTVRRLTGSEPDKRGTRDAKRAAVARVLGWPVLRIDDLTAEVSRKLEKDKEVRDTVKRLQARADADRS